MNECLLNEVDCLVPQLFSCLVDSLRLSDSFGERCANECLFCLNGGVGLVPIKSGTGRWGF